MVGLPEFELLWGRYPQESNCKNNVCQGINVAEQKDNSTGDLGGVVAKARLVRPFIDYIVNKIYDKSNADQEFRMAEQITAIVGDHEIDLGYAEEDDIQARKNAEIGGEVSHLAEDQVFGHPDDTRGQEYDPGDSLIGPEEPPDPELPENKDPFQKGIGIGDPGIAGVEVSQIITDGFADQSGQGHKKKGLIGFAKTAETNQPRNTG